MSLVEALAAASIEVAHRYMVLFSTLVAVDVFRSLGFALSLLWLHQLPSVSVRCATQAYLIQAGYVATAYIVRTRHPAST